MEDLETDGLVNAPAFSVVVPVYNEETGLAERCAALLDGLPPGAEVVFVCNGCTDRSEAILRETVGARALILLAPKGKAAAIRTGERHVTAFPRFYVDADVEIGGADLCRLAQRLSHGTRLVAPRLRLDLAGASRATRLLYRFAAQLPHWRQGAYHNVLGITEDVRARWGEFPEVIAEDTFIESQVVPGEKAIVPEVEAVVRPPRRLWPFIMVRTRWLQGERELAARGFAIPRVAGQRAAILRLIMRPGYRVGGMLYLFANIAARLLAPWRPRRPDDWYHDASARRGR